jgi:hypothetical protein
LCFIFSLSFRVSVALGFRLFRRFSSFRVFYSLEPILRVGFFRVFCFLVLSIPPCFSTF